MLKSIIAFFTSIFMAIAAFFGIGGKPADPVQKGQWPIERAAVIALAESEGIEVVTQDCSLTPQPGGTPSTREYTGIRLRDLLAYHGVDVDKLREDAYLIVASGDADGFSTNYNAALIKANTTLLAWSEDGKEVIRMCVKGGPAYQFVKNVSTLTLFA